MKSVLIVGAGLAGLTAACELSKKGYQATVLDKGRGVGGRLASRSIEGARFDHGAQYFSAKTPDFQQFVSVLQKANQVQKWLPNATFEHPRYVGVGGMNGVAKYLAESVDVRANEKVILIEKTEKGCIVSTEIGNQYEADILILTPPATQTLALIQASHLTLLNDIDLALRAITYAPCLALMITLQKPSQVPANGGIVLDNHSIAWIADNQQKGISALPSVTIHASVSFSKTYLDGDLQQAATLLLKAAEPWIPAELVNTWQLHRWRYSMASKRFDNPFLFTNQPFPIYFAGDGFGIGNVEGAFLSGLAVSQDINGL